MIDDKVYQALRRARGAMEEAMHNTPERYESEEAMEFVDAMVRVMEMVDQLARGTNPFEQNMN